MTDASIAPRASLSPTDRALIAEICALSATLDRHGMLAEVAAKGELLPKTILDEQEDARTRMLTTARDRCRDRVDALRRAKQRSRLLALTVPFSLGLAGTPYILHLLT